MKILAFAATSSSKSINKQLVIYAASQLEQVISKSAIFADSTAETEILDINDYELPLFSEDREVELGQPELALAFLDKIADSDVLMIAFAEHNGSYTVAYKNIFDWAWLDEWDRTDKNNSIKTLYNAKNFAVLKKYKFKIALVTPELHSTSPDLLGGESHQDAADHNLLFTRIKKIIKLNPDAICTDYPDRVKALIS